MTLARIISLVKDSESGKNQQQLKDIYGVSKGTVSNIISGNTHIKKFKKSPINKHTNAKNRSLTLATCQYGNSKMTTAPLNSPVWHEPEGGQFREVPLYICI